MLMRKVLRPPPPPPPIGSVTPVSHRGSASCVGLFSSLCLVVVFAVLITSQAHGLHVMKSKKNHKPLKLSS